MKELSPQINIIIFINSLLGFQNMFMTNINRLAAMDIGKLASRILFLCFVFSFWNCDKSRELSDSTNVDDLNITGINTTSFTATIKGELKNISKIDIALGKHGVLYCPKTDKAESIFKSWLEGNDNPDCHVYNTKDGFDNELFSAIIGPLYPETEYAFCLFSQGKDGSNRKISSVSTFTTGHFSPEFEELQIEDIHYIDATVKSSLKMDAKDAENCTRGLLLTEKPGGGINEALNITEITSLYNDDNPRFNVIVHGIKPDMNYYARLFVKYKGSDGNDTFLYGPEKAFSAKRSEEMAVDLGLPSGIKWAKCDLGEWEYNNDYQSDDLFFRWGSVVPSKRYDANKNNYEYWNETSNNYVEIGQEISNTEYDVAKVMMGGKWRMPKKEDVEELAEICNVKSFAEVEYNLYDHTKDQLIKDWCYEGIIIGPNNNRIKMSSNYMYWTGTVDEEQRPFDYCFYPIRDENSHGEVGNITLGTIFRKREEPHRIRPVWDPNL